MSNPAPSEKHAVDFVYDEARLLDEKRFDDWYELFDENGLYWMPLTRDQPDGLNHNSLFYEDRLLLKVRIERLKSPRVFAQGNPSYCHHVMQQPRVEPQAADNATVVRTPFIYVETQRDNQFMLAATAYHHLILVGDQIKIRMKKVELLNPDAGFGSIQMFL
ncbi:MAG: aromatic-ring-hydroxylating dioxygenase subunit beta [Burkholderiaceae bacterium]